MEQYRPILDWLDGQSSAMLDLVTQWAGINSHTFNLPGIEKLSKEISSSFQALKGEDRVIDLPPVEFVNSDGKIAFKPLGKAFISNKRPKARYQVLLVCHMDTVYSGGQATHDIHRVEDNILKGPGVADAKGGIVVMLKALEALERSPFKEKVGWQVIINSDEEIGSPKSRDLLKKAILRAQTGFVFEPCLPNGDFVGARKGSGNFVLVVHGRSAHAGRDLDLGRNAIAAIAKSILEISALNESLPGLTVNVGLVEGGQATNIVPDTAVARFNVRVQQFEDEEVVMEQLKRIANNYLQADGLSAELHGGFAASPKIIDGVTLELYESVKGCASQLGLNLDWHSSGGACDGNRLSSYGLPNVDTMGVKGGDIHSSEEYLAIDSLAERAKLAALVLMKLGNGELL